MKPKYSLIYPAYNEAGNLEVLIEKTVKIIIEKKYNIEILFLDDGSSDGTFEKINEITKKSVLPIKVLKHNRNMGLTQSLKTLISEAVSDTIIFLPADLQSDPYEDIPKLIDKYETGFDMVLGVRKNRNEGKEISSRLYNKVCSYLFDIDFRDMNWIKIFRKEIFFELNIRANWHRYIVPLASLKDYKIGEIETNWYSRKYGNSKYDWKRFYPSLLDIIIIKIISKFEKKPFYFFASIGLSFIIASIFLSVLLIIWYLLYLQQWRPFYFIGLAFFIVGIFFCMFGIMVEYTVWYQCKMEYLINRLENKQKFN